MILICHFAHLTKEVHVVNASKLVLVKEPDEALDLFSTELLDHLTEHVEQSLCSDHASI